MTFFNILPIGFTKLKLAKFYLLMIVIVYGYKYVVKLRTMN